MDRNQARAFLHDMMLARAFEERAAQEYMQGNIAGFLHLYPGEEAVAVGVLHACEASDYIVSTYREHVHALVRGTPATEVMAELFGKKDGCSRGMGGSMHLFDAQRRFTGGYAIVGETFPVAIGIGYGIVLRDLPEAVVCFFGDGAVNQGTFHESLNMAAMWRLPVLFVCENNQYQIGTEIHHHSAVPEVYKRASAYRIPAERIDGMDVFKVFAATQHALQQIRAGAGPQMLECLTYRFRGHSMADPGHYRPSVEVKAYQQIDPLKLAQTELSIAYPSPQQIAAAGPDCLLRLREHCFDQGHLYDDSFKTLEQKVADEVEAAVQFALASPEPTLEDAWQALLCNRGEEVLI